MLAVNKSIITGIILAGGKCSRMGTDKGLLKLNNKPFTQYIIDALKPLVSEILIVSDNLNYDVFGYKRIEDIIKDAGPVSGIYSGLTHSKTDYNLVLSCDIPLISTEVLRLLIEHANDTCEVIQIESYGKTMPLIALYKKECSNIFLNLLQNGERRLRKAVNKCAVKTIKLDVDNHNVIANINTQQELKDIQNAYKD
ncbi:molybdenum cofactor guanylyltransferase [Aestuariivivens marinum]|uniref:molybdenum cofactor guanylyltransferase n=1 Tax=Aestuariivivens marinum TaxID=2913555 RepID=UPI001F567E6A|nr:molybdenum cofactor guanylyltransferase [Aestuariivivens marinum]